MYIYICIYNYIYILINGWHFSMLDGTLQASSHLPDRRSDGDPEWLANGAQVELHSLQKAQALNGQRGEIVAGSCFRCTVDGPAKSDKPPCMVETLSLMG